MPCFGGRPRALLAAIALTAALLMLAPFASGHVTPRELGARGAALDTGIAPGAALLPSPAALTATVSVRDFEFPNGCTELPVIVSFNSSASGGSPPYNYTWTFGDGSSGAYGPSPSHSYAALGTYTATLTVTDHVGRTAQNQTIVRISLPPGCGPSRTNGAPWFEAALVLLTFAVGIAIVAAILTVRRRRGRRPPPALP